MRAGGDRVVHVLDDLATGGAQQLVLTFATEAARRGLAVTVVSLQDDADGPVGQRLRERRAEVLAVPRRGGRTGVVRQVGALAALLRARRPLAVQTHLTMAVALATPAARLAGAPVVATLHNTRTGDDGNTGAALRLETLALRRWASAVLAVGHVVEAAQRDRLSPRRAVVIPNATPPATRLAPDDRRALRRALVGHDQLELVVAVGRLVPQKGHDDLLTAFAEVAGARPAARLVVLGGGPQEAQLRARVAAEGLEGVVHLLGRRDDAQRVLAAADVFVSASLWEGLPVATLEAMASGLATVVTAVGDVPSVVDPSCGVLVPPGRPEDLARAVVDLLADPGRRGRLGLAAAARVAERHHPAGWVDQHLALYSQAAGGGRAVSRTSPAPGPCGPAGRPRPGRPRSP